MDAGHVRHTGVDVRTTSTSRFRVIFSKFMHPLIHILSYNSYYNCTMAGPYTNVLDLYLFPSMSKRHSAHLQRQSNSELPIERIWKTVESVWTDTVSAEVAR
jgi:hypothetical protein